MALPDPYKVVAKLDKTYFGSLSFSIPANAVIKTNKLDMAYFGFPYAGNDVISGAVPPSNPNYGLFAFFMGL